MTLRSSSVAHTLVAALRELGVRHVFGVPSGGWVDYLEALREAEGIDFVLTTHEGGAAMMAENVAAACRKVRRFKLLFLPFRLP